MNPTAASNQGWALPKTYVVKRFEKLWTVPTLLEIAVILAVTVAIDMISHG